MTDTGRIDPQAPPGDGVEPTVAARIEALRRSGAQGMDPVRFRYLEAVARRAQSQPQAVRRLLETRLRRELAAYEERCGQWPGAEAAGPAPAFACEPLAQLNRLLEPVRPGQGGRVDGAGMEFEAADALEIRSARLFRQAWSRISAEDQVIEAVQRGPGSAGPLNSHMLVLRSLELMRSLSPDYLRRFLAHAESLLWLEQAQHKHAAAAARPARRSRKK